MKFLEIKSEGLMDSMAISLIGASTKRDDTETIGQFGSGLNYSIAALVRGNYPFYIFSGENEIKIGTIDVSFGGKDFEQITVNGQPTSLTTTMGRDDWQGAYPFIREIYSNALDNDKNATIKIVDNFLPEAGFTKYIVEATPEIIDIVINIKDYFIDEADCLFANERGGILNSRKGAVIFRKGIRAWDYETELGSIFSYDLKLVDVNESRVLKNPYQGFTQIAILLESCTNKRILRQFINGIAGGNSGLLEHKCGLESYVQRAGSNEFVEVIQEFDYFPIELQDDLEDIDMRDRKGLPLKFIKRFLQYVPDLDVTGISSKGREFGYKEIVPTTGLFDVFTDAKTMLESTSYKERLTMPIKFVKFHKSSETHRIEKGTLLLSEVVETFSSEHLATLLIREQELIRLGEEDTVEETLNQYIATLFLRTLKKLRDE